MMSIQLKIFLIALLVFQIFLIVFTLKKKKLSMRFTSLWLFLVILMIIVVIFPKLILNLSKIFGFEAASNMIFLLGFFFLFYMVFLFTINLSIQNEKIKLLIQEVSLLKRKDNKNGK